MKRILIVEDDPSITQLLQMTFKHSGFESLNAPELKSAKAILKTECLDFAVIDIGLKDGLGYELVESMIKLNIPFIFFNGARSLNRKAIWY